MMTQLKVQANIDQERLTTHIKFIDSFSAWCRKQNWRVIVYGGYGLDGYLQQITRNHGDIDLVMYGLAPRSHALAEITDYLNKTLNAVEINSTDEDYFIDIKVKSKNIQGNFYYVQVGQDPFSDLNIVIKADGSKVTNSLTDFPLPVHGKLRDLDVEVQDQSAHFEDILRKRKEGDSLSKHDQDLENLKTIVQT